jgi:MFS transporter, NNP family, nitrate/nitrite transporter
LLNRRAGTAWLRKAFSQCTVWLGFRQRACERVLSAARFPLLPTFFPETKGAVTGIVGAAGGIGGFFPPLVLSVVRDATAEYVMGFVLLVAFAWLSAGQALAVRKPRPRPASA